MIFVKYHDRQKIYFINRGWRACVCGLAGSMILSSTKIPSIAAPIDWQPLIDGLERGCRPSRPLEALRAEMNARYTFEEGSRKQGSMHLPGAANYIRARNHGTYTTVYLPLPGSYRGLSVKYISFDMGHSNGINTTTIGFEDPIDVVISVMGKDVEQTMRDFAADPQVAMFGFYAKIVTNGEATEFICNTSTSK